MATPAQPAFLTIRQFGQMFALSRSSIYRAHHKSQLTIVKLNSRSVIAVEDGAKLLEAAPKLARKPPTTTPTSASISASPKCIRRKALKS
jgi:hypothetical protein